ncbi:MAG TPA: alpha/beta fold hydrolase [Sphingomicrobium sp.]|nr:alpha/beta fold hydrolase [Sphingomicrobium sp.]
MIFRVSLFASAIGLVCASPPALAQQTLAADAKAFGVREAVVAPDLSASGSKIMYLTPGPGRRTVAVVGDLATGTFTKMVSSDGSPESLKWCRFAGESRGVCRFGALVRSSSLGDILHVSRLISMDLSGADAKLLGKPQSAFDDRLRFNDAAVIDWLGGTSETVLVNRLYVPEDEIGQAIKQTKKGTGVDRLNVKTLRSEPVESPRQAAGYETDDLGHVRLMSITDMRDSGMLTGSVTYFYRTKDSRDWKDLFKVKDIMNPDVEPLAIDASIDSLYALRKKNGRYALYAIRLDGSMAERLVAENPRVDIDGVVRFGDGQRVIGYDHSDEEGERVYFDPEFKALAAALSTALPKSPIIDFVDSTSDGNKLLIYAGNDSDPGRYYLFDRTKKSLEPLMIVRPDLEGRTLASVKPVTVTAPDGAAIPAYLTLPPGKDRKGLPAVILPHGGPSSRDYWGFDPLAQFLAARGYAVLQPQYRGSAGYGDAWLNINGFRNWRTSIGDITASAKWLVAQGIADPNKLAILGWSYGGYAALQSAVIEPSLYKAVIAIAPVTDLQMAKDEARNFTNYDLIQRLIGSGPHVQEGSPLRHASAINAPVLLVHGTLDNVVRYAESKEMDEALKRAGKHSELLTFDGLDHNLDDSDARTQMLTKIGELLERTIGR